MFTSRHLRGVRRKKLGVPRIRMKNTVFQSRLRDYQETHVTSKLFRLSKMEYLVQFLHDPVEFMDVL